MALVATGALVSWPGLAIGRFLYPDEAVYAVVAQRWSEGALPYRDAFDHKPPLVYALFRVGLALAGGSLWGVRLLFALIAVLTGWVVAELVVRLRGPTSWLPAGAAGVLAVGSFYASATGWGAANTEFPMQLFCALALLLLLRRSGWADLAAGLCAGLALLAKPICLPVLAAFLVLTGLDPRRVARWSAGCLLAIAPFGLYFWAKGALPAAWEAIVTYNAVYRRTGSIPLLERAGVAARRLGEGLPALLPGSAILAVLARRVGRPALLALCWCALGALAVLLTGRFYPHYLHQLAVPLCLATGLALDALAPRPRLALVALLAILCAPTIVGTEWQLRYFRFNPKALWPEEAAREVAERTGAGEPILVIGSQPEIHFLARRPPVSRFFFRIYYYGPSDFARRARQELLEEIRRRPPRAVVIATDDAAPEAPRTGTQEWELFWRPQVGALFGGYHAKTSRYYVLLVAPTPPGGPR